MIEVTWRAEVKLGLEGRLRMGVTWRLEVML